MLLTLYALVPRADFKRLSDFSCNSLPLSARNCSLGVACRVAVGAGASLGGISRAGGSDGEVTSILAAGVLGGGLKPRLFDSREIK